MTIFGALRVKNEGRWIQMVVRSILPLCERVFVLDDNSTDGTPDLCEALGEQVTVIRKTTSVLDESLDKEMLLSRVMACVSDIHLRGNPRSPFWALAIDGDELLDPSGIPPLRAHLQATTGHSYRLPIRFLWDSDLSLLQTEGHRQVRTDRVYGRFAQLGRPSVFRLFNGQFRYQRTPWGGNFHCSSIPQELLHGAHETLPAPLWHLGYCYREDRIRKWQFYNAVDPNNEVEDRYQHIVQGDVPEVPASATLKHAGPLELRML